MQTLTIALLKDKGLEYMAAGKLGAMRGNYCVFESADHCKRCVAGATFDDETINAIRRDHKRNGLGLIDLVAQGLIGFPGTNDRVYDVYRTAQFLHDAWITGGDFYAPLAMNLTEAEQKYLQRREGQIVGKADLEGWLKLVQ